MSEAEYQASLIKKLEAMFPGCLIVKNDANYRQGIPDLTIFFGPRYAFLEVKVSEKSKERPNQRYYVEQASKNAFASFIYPENEEEVLRALQLALGA